MWQVWDVDHTSRNLLVEAKPSWDHDELNHLVCYPQMIFEKDGPETRGDAQEFGRFGREDSVNALVKAVRIAFQRYQAGEKRVLHFERIQSDFESRGLRFAPRIFTRHSISQIARNINSQSFIIRYSTTDDRRFALQRMSRLEIGQRFERCSITGGSRTAQMSHFYDLGLTMCALMKVGVNLLAAYCQKTPVNCESFKAVIQVIRGQRHPTARMIASNGFIRAADVDNLKAESSGHSFRLVYLNGEWIVYSSFFGGRIGAAVAFPGPNHEEWNTMNIIAPLHAKTWRVTTSSLLQPIKVYIEWSDSTKIIPSLKLQWSVSGIITEAVRSRKPLPLNRQD